VEADEEEDVAKDEDERQLVRGRRSLGREGVTRSSTVQPVPH
jgi:hypothetical protein